LSKENEPKEKKASKLAKKNANKGGGSIF